MGVDFLDIQFRLEKVFGFEDLGRSYADFLESKGVGVTAGDLHDFVCSRLVEEGRPPHGSWPRLKILLHDALGAKPAEVCRGSRLMADLGAT